MCNLFQENKIFLNQPLNDSEQYLQLNYSNQKEPETLALFQQLPRRQRES